MKNKHAQALARLGASKGGIARRENLTRERMREIARFAAHCRWHGRPKEK